MQVASSYAQQKRDMERALADDTHALEMSQKELEQLKIDFVSELQG